jgi:hydrogenase nickel incorporation protein HypA/HybF
MHEISLIEGVLALIENEQRREAFSRVRKVCLTVGALGHAEPDALRFCFGAVVSGTIADGAALEIDIVAGKGWCHGCVRHVPLPDRYAGCPICGSTSVRLTQGDELRLSEMEVE